ERGGLKLVPGCGPSTKRRAAALRIGAGAEGGFHMIRIGINGLGRIGRTALRAARLRDDVQVVAANDLIPADYLAHSIKYDSVHGRFQGRVGADGATLLRSEERRVGREGRCRAVRAQY